MTGSSKKEARSISLGSPFSLAFLSFSSNSPALKGSEIGFAPDLAASGWRAAALANSESRRLGLFLRRLRASSDPDSLGLVPPFSRGFFFH
jgi:hypothetical protein